jgi:hypothetical protein
MSFAVLCAEAKREKEGGAPDASNERERMLCCECRRYVVDQHAQGHG